MTGPRPQAVRLRAVDEATLTHLVRAALADADADEVTAPVTPGNVWTPERISWLTAYHADRRAGLDGPAGESTWAIEADGEVVGSMRLKRIGEPGVVETGIWLRRGARGRGIAQRALAAVLVEAAAWGAREVWANTRTENAPALAVLRALDFECADAVDGEVWARRRVG
jgi:RimJ/RimL family protein N-acetyltransferase